MTNVKFLVEIERFEAHSSVEKKPVVFLSAA
jgi:hypothetical protein